MTTDSLLAFTSGPRKDRTRSRIHEYVRSRGGIAPFILCVLSQLHVDKCWLVASLSSSQEARVVMRELGAEGVSTRYCGVWDGAGVPAAWVLHTDIPHEEFVSLMGPLLVPEHYPSPESLLDSPTLSPPPLSPNNGAPFEWIHFEGRSVKTALRDLQGLDSLASKQRWRSQCVFSVDVGRRAKQGIEALILHADVVFLNQHYAQAQFPAYASAPRVFRLALTGLAPPHALLVAYWGAVGAAVLSAPTREYFQSSGWSAPPTPAASVSPPRASPLRRPRPRRRAIIHAVARRRRACAARAVSGLRGTTAARAAAPHRRQGTMTRATTPTARRSPEARAMTDRDLRTQPSAAAWRAVRAGPGRHHRGAEDRGRAVEAVRVLEFATGLAGLRARRRIWDGLGEEMVRPGWFDA
ncbi:hypothetical protein BJY52DRAFT_1194878 [Lactarius psammicola]|nr:hypothetical protein BJY52DRAFT_1194878 [Lactarius psammicola]